MAHEYAKEAKASHDRKLRSYGGETSSTADKPNKDGDATNFAGFRALNTDKQAGMSPIGKQASMSDGTMSRIMRKKGGKVVGAASLKRLDKAPRKGRADGGGLQGTGQRVGPIPSADEQQMKFDPTTKVGSGVMPEGIQRKKGGKIQDYEARSHESQGAQGKRPFEGHKKGGRVKKADGGGFLEDILGSILGGDEAPATESAAPSRRRAAPQAHRPVVTHRRIHEVETPLPPSRPSEYSAGPAPISDADATANFLRSQGVGAQSPIGASTGSSTDDPFFARELYGRPAAQNSAPLPMLARKRGGKVARYGFEGSNKDEREDKMLEKKYGMSHKEWEASDLDKKHDRQESMKGLKKGGRTAKAAGGAFADYEGGESKPAKSSGGKGKTTVNIMIGQPQGQQQGINPMALAAMADMAKGAGGPPQMMPPPPPPSGMPPQGAPPPAMMGPPPQMPPQGPPPGAGPMPRKDGGKVQVPYRKPSRKDDYPALDFGSGGGFGRKQKIDSYGTKGPSSKNNY